MSLPRATLARYITPGCTFVETGTRWGDRLIAAYELGAEMLFSCETDAAMLDIARRHVADAVRGDVPCDIRGWQSVQMLDALKDQSAKDAVVFLDAHTETESWIGEELAMIAGWKNKPRIILIDDVRLWKGWGVDRSDVIAILATMGYAANYADGIEPGDVMVGTLR